MTAVEAYAKHEKMNRLNGFQLSKCVGFFAGVAVNVQLFANTLYHCVLARERGPGV